MAAARGALDQLVANGTIDQSQADTIEQDVAAGSVDSQALVADGVVTEAQMQAVSDALDQVKHSFAEQQPAEPDHDAKPAEPDDTTRASDDIVAAARSALDQLVANGTIDQSQANTVMEDVTAGSIDREALVAEGVLTEPQMQAVADAIDQVKRSFESTGGASIGATKTTTDATADCDAIATKLAQAVKDGKMTQEEANQNQQLAGCTSGGAN